MSNPTPVPIVAVVTAPIATPTDPLANVVDRMKAEIIRHPDEVGSPSVQTVLMYENLQQSQQAGTQLTAIAAAFKPPPPAETPLEGLAYVAAQLTYALQAPFADLQTQISALSTRLDGLEARHGQLASSVETQFKQVDVNVSREMAGMREAMKELKDMQRAHEQTLARLATLERSHRNTVHHLQMLQRTVGKIGGTVEGWEEMVKALDRHISEIVIVEREPPHDDGRKRR